MDGQACVLVVQVELLLDVMAGAEALVYEELRASPYQSVPENNGRL